MKINQLLQDIDQQISLANAVVGKLNVLSFQNQDDEEYEFAQMELESHLGRIDTSIRMALEFNQFPELLKAYLDDSRNLKRRTDLELLPLVGDLYSPAISIAWRYHSSLVALCGESGTSVSMDERRLNFERILNNTPKIVRDRNINPENEADVRKCVYELLIHVFPDTVREIPIAQVTKSYKPDIGVVSLRAAAEYKFADNEDEVKTAIGGLYEDMRGYAGSEDWKYFYAVIYMTEAFFTSEQIKAQFQHSEADENWQPILLVGNGARKRKSPLRVPKRKTSRTRKR